MPNPTLVDLPALFRDAAYERDVLARVGPLTAHGRNPDPAALDELTREPTPANILARAFYLARAVPRASLESVLTAPMCQLLLDEGLLRESDAGMYRADCAIVPARGFLGLRDFDAWATGKPLPEDHVLGVGIASAILADLTVRRRGEHVLDLGTGQGFQAAMAAAHAARVVGTDINPRALRLAALAMRINNIPHVEFRQGSFFEPVEHEKSSFDLLVSNPPFVIAPPHDLSAMGGRWIGDSFVENLIRRAPEFLRDDGWATILCNWHHAPDDWQSRPASWIAGRGVDAWLVKFKTDDPRTYAENWLRESAGTADPAALAAARARLPQWLDYYASLGVGAISMGAVFLHKRPAPDPNATRSRPPNFLRTDAIPLEHLTGTAGEQVQRLLRNELLLRSLPQESALLDVPLAVASTCELVQHLRPQEGQWKSPESILEQTTGFRFSIALAPLPALLLARLDGTRPARDIITDLANQMNADPAAAFAQTTPFLIKMLELTHLSAP